MMARLMGGKSEEPARPELRFAIDARVQCRTGPGTGDDAWSTGSVVKLWYAEPGWPKSRVAPYQIQLDDGRLIFAPMDDDRVIRELTGILLQGKIPVTVLVGFLGAGKTTLLNYILKVNHGKKYAVIENEIGAVGIDNQLLDNQSMKTEESVTILDNGCLCCTVRDDLVKAIKSIVEVAKAKEKAGEVAEGKRAIDGILIETTGIADPGPICKTFYGDPFCSTWCKIDGVVTVVDAVHFVTQLTRERSDGAVNESAQQVAFSDKILMNKIDAASVEQVAQATQAVRNINHLVPITKCSLGKSPDAVPLETLLSIDAFDVKKIAEEGDIDLTICGVATAEEPAHGHEGHGDGHGHGEGHECGEGCEEDHGHAHGGDGHEHGEGCEEDHGHGGGDGHGHGHGHAAAPFRHDTGIGSFVCELEGTPIDFAKFQLFIHELLEKSEHLYRYKGILAVKSRATGSVERRVIQGVHDMMDMDNDRVPWPAEKPVKSQLVLIGRDLEAQRWKDKFATLAVCA